MPARSVSVLVFSSSGAPVQPADAGAPRSVDAMSRDATVDDGGAID
jgi:hypothetical protein